MSYEDNYRLVIKVDPGLAAYYRSTIPKAWPWQKPMWEPHITVVRSGKEVPTRLSHWGKYQGEVLDFRYQPYVYVDSEYYWLNVWCERLGRIRTALGLPPMSEWTLPPSGGYKCFHVTIANRKNLI